MLPHKTLSLYYCGRLIVKLAHLHPSLEDNLGHIGTADRALASYTSRPVFESNHRKLSLNIYLPTANRSSSTGI